MDYRLYTIYMLYNNIKKINIIIYYYIIIIYNIYKDNKQYEESLYIL